MASDGKPASADAVSVVEPGRTHDLVVMHPLVLLSAVDHHYRIAKDIARKRVVGVLLGETYKGRVDVTNSFAVPFEEDPKDPSIFYLDHDYLEAMFLMHKKVSAREKIVGFYSTSPRIRPSDIDVDALFRNKYLPHPILVLIDVRPDIEGLPVQAYQTVETVKEGKENVRTFAHIPSEVGAYEAEEVGVEHLLRDINDPSVSSLAGELRQKLVGLRGLSSTLTEVATYLRGVVDGSLPINNDILYHVQTLLAMLPNTGVETVVESMFETTNDQHLVMYVASLTRAVLALHDLVINKAKYKDEEDNEGREDKKEEKKDEKEKDGKKAEAEPKKGGKS